jgi:hypothetical protein
MITANTKLKWTAALVCSSGFLRAQDVTRSLDQAAGTGWGFRDLANAVNSNRNNIAMVAFGLLVGMLLSCVCDPAAKDQIFRGIKTAWKKTLTIVKNFRAVRKRNVDDSISDFVQ